mgnify:CR=1 FL=1
MDLSLLLCLSFSFACREAIIGDHEVWSPAGAGDYMTTKMQRLAALRFGLRFGSAALDLPGSAGRSGAQDALQFGTLTLGGSQFQGLDAVLAFFERRIGDCVRAYGTASPSAPHAGLNLTAIDGIAVWQDVSVATRGEVAGMLLESETLYANEAHDKADTVSLIDTLVNCTNVALVIILYVTVLRVMVRSLLDQAKRTEQLLGILPESVAETGPLTKYFVRSSASHE